MTRDDPRNLRWPPERFLWALLDGCGWARPGQAPEGLLPALEDELPAPLADLHAVCAPIGDGALLICAARRSDLDALEPGALRLSPTALPEFTAGCEPAALNLLVGEYESPPVKRARARTHALAAGTALAAAALLCVGLSRRAEVWRAEAESHREAAAHALRAVLSTGADPAAEIARLHRAADAATSERPITDAAVALGEVLSGWPAQVPCVAHSLAVGQGGATLSLSVEGDPTPFLRALRPPAGWFPDEPRINAAEQGTRLSLRLRPQESVAP